MTVKKMAGTQTEVPSKYFGQRHVPLVKLFETEATV
jgi:hypothetical protein